jgi:hypothetical protein
MDLNPRQECPLTRPKVVALVFTTALAALLLPSVAKAQNRGTLQVSARVVDSRPSFAALEATRALAQDLAAGRSTGRETVATVAQISVTRKPATREVVITVDYSKN